MTVNRTVATAKRTTAKQTAAKKTTAKKAASKKPAAKTAATTTAKEAAAAKTAAKKAIAKKAAAKRTTAKKAAAKKTTAKKAAAKKAAAKKTAAKITSAAGQPVHCYRLIFQVEAGGSRKAESFVAGTLAEAKRAALADLESGVGAYHALIYGEEIVLQCWEGSKKRATVDLHPYITYQLEGREPVRFKPGKQIALDSSAKKNEGLLDALCDEEIEVAVTIDWASIKLPTLRGRPLRKGQSIALEHGRVWKHGFHGHWDEPIDC